jgi:hypothetical protein
LINVLLIPVGIIGGFAAVYVFMGAWLWLAIALSGNQHATINPNGVSLWLILLGGFVGTFFGLRKFIYRWLDGRE